ncbi:hypothetical protein LTR66_014950 [Elasticomyces elasticus]|nr:hypothetical protein LTR66_014950 [Elasticomyces elasticus]
MHQPRASKRAHQSDASKKLDVVERRRKRQREKREKEKLERDPDPAKTIRDEEASKRVAAVWAEKEKEKKSKYWWLETSP